MAGRPATDPMTALRHRQAALKAYDKEQQHKYLMVLAGVCCVIAAGALAWGIVRFAAADRVAAAEPPSPPLTISVAEQETTPPPAAVVFATPAVPEPAPPPEITTAEVAATNATPVQSLPRADIAEAQRLLAAFGYGPGPVDGNAGPRTQEAARRYQEKHGLPQTGAIDETLLQALRQEPPPPRAPTAVAAAQHPQPASTQYAQAQPPQRRTPAVFRPVEMAGQQITNWLSSVFR